MKSNWRTMPVEVAGRTFYQAYRLMDLCADDTRKNRETYGGYYETLQEAESLAERLNKEGE